MASKNASAVKRTDCTDVALTRVPLSGGVLVYRELEIGRKLFGVEDVTDWDDLRDGMLARGHSRGDWLHIDVLDE